MRTTFHLDSAYCSPRTGRWNMRLIERLHYRGGWFWLKKKTRDVPLHVVGFPDDWMLVEHGFTVHKRSPINRFCNAIASLKQDDDPNILENVK